MPILLLGILVAQSGCGRKRGDTKGDGPVGGALIFDRALETAVSRAEPDGDVLVIGWTAESPPPPALYDLILRWRPYGLVAIGVNPDLAGSADRKGTIARLREIERTKGAPMRSLLYDGDPAGIYKHFEGIDAVPFVALIDTRGKTIWVDRGFHEIGLLDALLKSRLGEPPIAALL